MKKVEPLILQLDLNHLETNYVPIKTTIFIGFIGDFGRS